MKRLKKQRSVIPVYLIALWWAVGGFGLRIHKASQFVLWAAVSVVIFFAGRLIWKDRTIEEDIPEPQPEPQPEDPEVAELRRERDRAISEMRRLNESIQDPVISGQIDHIEATTVKIFEHVLAHPEKKSQIRRFLSYYLPTTIKLLNSYDRLDDAGVAGSNIDGAKGRIAEVMASIVTAFDKQLDALFQGEVMDINAEIKVLQSILSGDGLVDGDMPAGSNEG